jgi:hypothetical protein
MQAVGHPLEALEWVFGCKRTLPRIIPPRAEIDQVVVVQLAGEAERLRGGAALRHAEGAEAQTRGGEGRAGVVEGLADTAEGRGGGFLKHLHLVEDPKRDFGRSH